MGHHILAESVGPFEVDFMAAADFSHPDEEVEVGDVGLELDDGSCGPTIFSVSSAKVPAKAGPVLTGFEG